jgi:hypothetical protein
MLTAISQPTFNPALPMSFRFPLLLTGALAFATGAFAQTSAAANRPNPPAPPRTDAPGTPINPQQASTPAAQNNASGVTSQAPDAEPAAAATPLRELNFAEADVDGDKKVSLTEFANYVGNRPANKSTDPLSAEVIERFRQLDQNNDAFLSESEANTPPQPQQMQQQQLAPSTQPRRG